MNKRHALIAAVAVTAALALTGCTSSGDPEAMITRCEGPDKVFIIDDSDRGTAMFVLANHPECAK